ncbi:MAG TPA: hypothetical protein VN661_07190 [Candidatus Acidoferrales bacterium]|nr:hypothetical protein [Candidatus Acidoferrales bacterium]
MSPRGKLIVLEGIDGSGKGTQLDFLARAFEARKLPFTRLSFPNYSGFFGQMAAQFLNGAFGPLDAVDPHFSVLLYAGDRLEAKERCESDLAQGKILLADRYVASNLAHQGARMPAERREVFFAWVRKLEYEVYGLPAEDMTIYLRVPAEEAQHLIAQKAPREYTQLRRDIQEADAAHLRAALAIYDDLSRDARWARIECFDEHAQRLRPPDEIHREVLAVVDERVLAGARPRG